MIMMIVITTCYYWGAVAQAGEARGQLCPSAWGFRPTSLYYATLRYAMLCYAMLRYATLRYAMRYALCATRYALRATRYALCHTTLSLS